MVSFLPHIIWGVTSSRSASGGGASYQGTKISGLVHYLKSIDPLDARVDYN